MRKVTSGDTETTLLDTTIVGQPWQPQYRLGIGVDAVTGQLRATAVKPFKVTPSPTVHPEFQYSFVQSESDVQSLISASLKASYNLEGVTVSGSTSYLEELAVSELSVTLVAEVVVQQSQYSLAPTYELAVTPDPDFRRKYGDYFVAGYRAGSSMYVVYQCRFASSEQRTKFSAALAADVPQVLSVEGSSSFERVAKQHSANVSVRIRAQGVSTPIPDPPKSGWTAESVVSVLIPWFNSSMQPEPLEGYLQAYRLIDPDLSGEVPIAPDVFAQLGYLYNRFWLARAYMRTCPDFGRRPVEAAFTRLHKAVEANQASLATDVPKIELLTAETERLLDQIHEVTNRQSFYAQVIAASRTEPPAGQNFDADNGQVRWGYGFQQGGAPGVVVTSTTDTVSADWKIGWNEHVFSYRNSGRVIVGWDLVCNRSSNGGDWHKVSDTVIGRSSGDVYVKSDYDRGYSWTITWYTVDASLYPPGPWTSTAALHGAAVDGADVDVTAAEEYWTPERMRAALPVQVAFPRTVVDEPPAAGAPDEDAAGTFRTLPSEPTGDVQVGQLLTERVAHPQEFPQRTVGKLFFRRGGQDLTASAFVVHTSGLMTAAHCLVMNGQQSTDLVFVPAYEDGTAPFGVWLVDRTAWPHAWVAEEVPAWDAGMCTVRPTADGTTVGEVVGWVGLTLGQDAGVWDGLGYPVQPTTTFPFDGQAPWRSEGSRVAVAAPATVAKRGDLTSGVSGGPWFVPGTAQVNGLHSWGEPAHRLNIGPEFTAWIGQLYHHVFG